MLEAAFRGTILIRNKFTLIPLTTYKNSIRVYCKGYQPLHLYPKIQRTNHGSFSFKSLSSSQQLEAFCTNEVELLPPIKLFNKYLFVNRWLDNTI